jgi:hypothetical protein
MKYIRRLFLMLQKIGEVLTDDVHIIKHSEFEEKIKFIIYHSNGHCVIVEREKVDIAEDEQCENIDGYSYYFSSDLYEGFKAVSIGEVIKFIKDIKK